MKKIISLLLVCAACLMMVGCGNEKKETEAEAKTAETNTAETSTEEEAIGPNGLKKIEVGEALQIDAKYGSYKLTVTGIERTDWWERKHHNNKKSVVLLSYEVENINFSSILSEGVKVEYDLFKILDSKKGVLSPFLWYFDDVAEPGTVKPGEKASGSIPYVLERDSDYFDVIFTRVTGDVAEVRVEM